VFQSVHNLAHPGTKATARLVAQCFVWPGVQKDCCTWARACQSCQRSKVSRHTVIPLSDLTPPAARFLHVHTDLVGPLPMPAGYTYCLTAVDHITVTVARHWLVPSPWLASALFTATRLLPSNHCLPGRCLASAKRVWLVATSDLWWTKWHWGRFSPSTSFLLPIFIPLTAPTVHHHLSSGAGTIGQTVAAGPTGLSLAPPQETKKTNKRPHGMGLGWSNLSERERERQKRKWREEWERTLYFRENKV
jgi:hypothetical protein